MRFGENFPEYNYIFYSQIGENLLSGILLGTAFVNIKKLKKMMN